MAGGIEAMVQVLVPARDSFREEDSAELVANFVQAYFAAKPAPAPLSWNFAPRQQPAAGTRPIRVPGLPAASLRPPIGTSDAFWLQKPDFGPKAKRPHLSRFTSRGIQQDTP